MGNTKHFFITGATREPFDRDWLMEQFTATDATVHFSGTTFIAAVESCSMSADAGVHALVERCKGLDLTVLRHDVNWPDIHGLRLEAGHPRQEWYANPDKSMQKAPVSFWDLKP